MSRRAPSCRTVDRAATHTVLSRHTTRRCIYELVTAIDNQIPIVAVFVASKRYDFAAAGKIMLHLDSVLDEENPGASKVLTANGIDLKDAAWKLSSTIPNVISVKFDPSGSQNNIMAAILDLVDAMRVATPVTPDKKFDEWLAARGEDPVSGKQHGAGDDNGRRASRMLANAAPLPPECPDLPRGYVVRATILEGIKSLLFPTPSKSVEDRAAAPTTAKIDAATTPGPSPAAAVDQLAQSQRSVVAIQGMGVSRCLRSSPRTTD